MRILIVSTFFPPLNSIASLRPHSWAKYWSLAGHDVVVLTTKKAEVSVKLDVRNPGYRVIEIPIPFFYSMKQKYHGHDVNQKSLKCSLKSFLKKKLELLRCSTGIMNACRMPDSADLWMRPAFKAIQKESPFDVVVSTSGPYNVHLLANKIKKRGLAARWVADFRDRWSDSLQFPGVFPLNALERYLEKKIVANCNAITTVSEPFSAHYKQKYQKNVTTIYNGFDFPEKKQSSSRYFQEDKFRIVYTGSFWGKFQDPTPLFEALQKISENKEQASLINNLEILFFGAQISNLACLIEAYGVEKWVKIQGMVEREEALTIQNEAQLLLFLPWNDERLDGVLSGKIYEYLFAETSIISIGAKQMEESQRLLLSSGKGTLLHNVDEIVDFLSEQLRNPNKSVQQLPVEFINLYSRENLAQKMLDVL